MRRNAAKNIRRSKLSKDSAAGLCVLHAFQKKSKRGIATPQKELDLVRQRLAAAEQDY